MGVATSCRVANIVITIVTKGYIGHTTLCKVLYILKLMLQSKTVLYSKHDALTSLALIFVKVGRCTSNTDIALVLLNNLLYFVEDKVGIDSW